ncbi:MAG: TetR/AcrR family transcriptional regulator [Acidimicrobiales bacterium]|nr:TetR/AcrR family transcriptional regulator [Acidimicrobiales bacterium]
MRKRGRPRGVDSADTKKRIITVSRLEFSKKGFDGASIASIASEAELAPSAIYNHYETKIKLYEAVFIETADEVWSDVSSSLSEGTLFAAVTNIIGNSRSLAERLPHYSNFLASVPVEALLHPEFGDLLDRRTKYQDETFNELACLGVRTGELDGFSIEEGREILRALVMGWFFERHFRDEEPSGSGEALIKLIKILGGSTYSPSNNR